MEEGVFVTGYSGRFPGCSSVTEFWAQLCKGRDFSVFSPNEDTSQPPGACVDFLGHLLEPNSPRNCVLLLQVVYEALSDAGYSKDDLLDSDTAVFINLSTSSDVKGCEEDGANASSSRSSAEQISSTFGLRGPSVMLAAGNQGQGEVGGLVTLDLALRCIRSGAVSRALVVDGDYMGTTVVAVLLESEAVSPEGGVLRVRGSGVGWGGDAQVALFEEVCSEHKVDPREVVYVEAQHDFLHTHFLAHTSSSPDMSEERRRRDDELRALDQVYGCRDIPLSSSSITTALPSSLAEDSSSSSSSSRSPPLTPDPLYRKSLEEATATMRLRQENVYVFASKATTLSSGATWTLPVPVTGQAATIRYTFDSQDGSDLIFAMYYVTEKTKRVIVPQRLFDFSQDVTAGQFDLRGPGTLYLRWANTHTWFGEKILSYEVDIREVEHPVLENPQKQRITESMQTLHDIVSVATTQKSSLSALDSFIDNYNFSELSVLEKEYYRQKAILLTKKNILKSLNSLKRRATSIVRSTEDKRLALGLRTLNSYQLSQILLFLTPKQTHLVCKHWTDVCCWDQKNQRCPPSSDYAEDPASKFSLSEEVDSINIDHELNGIIGNYVDSEISSPKSVAPLPTSTYTKSARSRGPLVGSLRSAFATSFASCSALMQLIKVICIFSEQIIPPSPPGADALLSPASALRPFLTGRLLSPDTKQTVSLASITESFADPAAAVIAINSMSAGGTVVHVLCSVGSLQTPLASATRTRYLCGRTQHAVEQYIKAEQLNSAAWQKHLRQSSDISTFPWRGVVNYSADQSTPASCTPVDVLHTTEKRKRVSFLYAGHGTPWQEVAQGLWRSSTRFREVLVEGCTGLPIDIKNLFSMPSLSWIQLQLPDFGITLLQIGLTVLLQEAGIYPDVLVGKGVGEIACSFADGCTTAAEAIRIAFYRSQLGQSLDLGGLMLEVEMDLKNGLEFIKEYPNCVIACYNSPTKVTFSGKETEIKVIEESLQEINVKTRMLSTGGVSYHSLLHAKNADAIKKRMKEAMVDIPVKLRSSKWISTSCTNCIMSIPHRCCYPSLSYEVHNICNVVDFASALPALSSHMFVFEIGSSAVADIFSGTSSRETGAIVTSADEGAAVGGSLSSGAGDRDRVVYQSVDGKNGSLLALTDRLWLHGTPLVFARRPCLVPIMDRLSINWGDGEGRNDLKKNTFKNKSKSNGKIIEGRLVTPRASSSASIAKTKTELCGLDPPSVPDSSGSLLYSAVQRVPLRKKTTSNARGFVVHLSIPGDLSSLHWLENDCDPNCEIKFCGINPIDVKAISTESLTEDVFDEEDGEEDYYKVKDIVAAEERSCRLGVEFSGVREDGVAVMGVLPGGGLATHVRTSGRLLWAVPSHLSLEEAATLPLDYCTAYDALLTKANIQSGQAVLIDDICAGVGQAAYQICRYRNCLVWAVCPPDMKQWVHEKVGVAAEYLYESASNPLLLDAILQHTRGTGVDAVFHSSSRRVQAPYLEVLKQFGQYCVVDQWGRTDAFSGHSLRLAAKKHVSVHFVNVEAMLSSPSLCEQVRRKVQEGLLNGEVVPKQYRVYSQVETALTAGMGDMCSGFKPLVQLGKATRLFAHKGGGGISGADKEKATRVFKTSGTHVLIGGCNKTTLDLASFLLQKGATRICFVQEDCIDVSFPDSRMSCVHCDISVASSAEEMLLAVGGVGADSLIGLWYMEPLSWEEMNHLHNSKTDAETDTETGEEKTGISGSVGVTTRAKEWLIKLRSIDKGTRALSSLELFVVWCGLQRGAGYPWALAALCQERKDQHLPAVVIQLQLPPLPTASATGGKINETEGGDVRPLLVHLGDISCCENTVVLIS